MNYYYLIKRGLYYRPESKGYTANVFEAGQFPENVARRTVKDCHGDVSMVEVKMQLVAHDPVPDPDLLQARITELRRALEDIGTSAHCIAKSGLATTPTLADAWNRFMEIEAKASNAIYRDTHPADPIA